MADTSVEVVLVTRRTSGVGRRMESVLARLQLRRREGVRICRIDADARPELVRRLGVQEIPSIVIVRNMLPFAWLPGRATLGEIERALAGDGAGEGAEPDHAGPAGGAEDDDSGHARGAV
jgi:thioredoxin-like negative regulator of GroEL